MRVYIAGPMRGWTENNYPAFREAASLLRAHGHDVVSPVEINHGPADDGQQAPEHYLLNDLRELLACDGIALLPGWRQSVGARCEAAVAATLGLTFLAGTTGEPIPAPPLIHIRGGYERAPGEHPRDRIARAVEDELDRATAKFPTWASDPLHALAVVGEEVGELTRAVLQATYEHDKGVTAAEIMAEAIQAAAMTHRFLLSLGEYEFSPGRVHRQETLISEVPASEAVTAEAIDAYAAEASDAYARRDA